MSTLKAQQKVAPASVSPEVTLLDLAIIGSGPAALTAALYAARADLKVTVFERQSFGGALVEIDKISNFPGFVGPGPDLAKQLKNQAEFAGAKFAYGECTSVKPLKSNNSSASEISDEKSTKSAPEAEKTKKADPETEKSQNFGFTLEIDGGPIVAKTVLIATGSEPRPLEVKTKTPISYCALCDAPLYKGKNIIVVGGGNSAVQESLYLAQIVAHLTLISHSSLAAEPSLIDRLKTIKNITILENTEPTTELLDQADGIFVFIGKRPAAQFLPKNLLDDQGYIITDQNQMTTLPGLFAAGDVRQGSTKQAITAAADGATAAIKIAKFLQN